MGTYNAILCPVCNVPLETVSGERDGMWVGHCPKCHCDITLPVTPPATDAAQRRAELVTLVAGALAGMAGTNYHTHADKASDAVGIARAAQAELDKGEGGHDG